MEFEIFIEGLEKRGFVDLEGICSMANCNKNKKHYILYTDGLVLYSNFPWTHDNQDWLYEKEKLLKDSYYRETWGLEDEFDFEKLDEVMNIIDL